MTTIFAWIALFLSPCLFATDFEEPYTGMRLTLPDVFIPCEDLTDTSTSPYWYTFTDLEGSILSIEIEEGDDPSALSTHFHKTISDCLQEKALVCEEFEFGNLTIGEIAFTKLKVSLLALTDEGSDPLYFCDYLFVRDSFGITIGLMKNRRDPNGHHRAEEMMVQILESISFDA